MIVHKLYVNGLLSVAMNFSQLGLLVSHAVTAELTSVFIPKASILISAISTFWTAEDVRVMYDVITSVGEFFSKGCIFHNHRALAQQGSSKLFFLCIVGGLFTYH